MTRSTALTNSALLLSGLLFLSVACSRKADGQTAAGQSSTAAARNQAAADPTLAAASPGPGSFAPITIKDDAYRIIERVLFKTSGKPAGFVVGPGAENWACIWRDPATGRVAVTADGKLLGTYGGVHAMEYTAARKLVFVAGPTAFIDEINAERATNGDMKLVVDGIPGPGYELVQAMDPQWVRSTHPPRNQCTLVFSEDGKRVAYIGVRGQNAFVNVDGKEFGPYEQVIEVCFSPDGRRTGWITSKGPDGKHAITIDGGASQPVGGAARYLRFSPDGKSWVYTSMSKEGMAWLYGSGTTLGSAKSTTELRGARVGSYPGTDGPAEFTSDGIHVFSYSKSGKVVLDHAELLQASGLESMKECTVRARELVCTGLRQTTYFDFNGALLRRDPGGWESQTTWESPDHMRLIRVSSLVRQGHGEQYDLGQGKTFRLENPMGSAFSHVFGPGNKLAMVVGRPETMPNPSGMVPVSVVVEDQMGDPFESVESSTISFSATGDHFAYAAKKRGKWRIVADRKELSPQYGQIASSPFGFDGPSSFHLIAVRDNQVVDVHVTGPK